MQWVLRASRFQSFRVWSLGGCKVQRLRFSALSVEAAEDVFKDHVVLYKTISLYGW